MLLPNYPKREAAGKKDPQLGAWERALRNGSEVRQAPGHIPRTGCREDGEVSGR